MPRRSLMKQKELELAKKFLEFHSPLVGGWQGDLMRRYLRWREKDDSIQKGFK